MANCKECVHYDVCEARIAADENCPERNYTENNNCSNFKDRNRFVELPYTPIPLICDEDKSSSDVQCPCCGTDLSGHYTDGDEEPLSIIQCYNCGMICDNTKVITKKEAEKALKKKDSNVNK